MNIQVENLSREDLYELLWTKPLGFVAADYGLSAPLLRQLCMNESIPLPTRGHRFGKEGDKRISLPFIEKQTPFDLKTAVAKASNSLHYPGETTSSFKVFSKLINPDLLIVRAQKGLKPNDEIYGVKDMIRSSFGDLNIRATQKHIDRALSIMDTLVKIWQLRGYRIVIGDKETHVKVRKVDMRISLREVTKVLPGKDRFGVRLYEPPGD